MFINTAFVEFLDELKCSFFVPFPKGGGEVICNSLDWCGGGQKGLLVRFNTFSNF
jgi:hypothetical protein